jgi:hypothetical protein
MANALRPVIGLVAALMVVGGLATLMFGGEVAPTGVWPLVLGVLGIIAAVFERPRYRSEEAAPHADAGSGGYRPTEEVFVDPTSGQRMRVWVDPASGERSYRREGE